MALAAHDQSKMTFLCTPLCQFKTEFEMVVTQRTVVVKSKFPNYYVIALRHPATCCASRAVVTVSTTCPCMFFMSTHVCEFRAKVH